MTRPRHASTSPSLLALGLAIAALTVAHTPTSAAAVPLLVPVQGVVRDNSGALVADGAFEVVFALYEAEAGGEAVWTETWPPGGGDCQASPTDCVAVTGGVFDLALGTHEPLSIDLLASAGSL